MKIRITAPIDTPAAREQLCALRAGDRVLISGSLLTARDAAHKRLCECLVKGLPLPVDIRGQLIYYVGPAPAQPGRAVGPAGPTSSYRMDAYTPALLEQGLAGMIGKGVRSDAVVDSIREHRAVYFAAIGGAAAVISRSIVKSEPLCYPELLSEAICRLEVVGFPAVVAVDSTGRDLYREAPARYARADR